MHYYDLVRCPLYHSIYINTCTISGIEVLKERSNKKIIRQRYVDRVLQESATKILCAQDKLLLVNGTGLSDIKANNAEFTHFNSIINKVAYGFTQDIKNELAQKIDIVI